VQAPCPQCGQRIAVDDARVPDRPFAVKCPKCQATVRFPGKTGAAAPATGAPGPAPAAPAPAPPRAEPPSSEARQAAVAQLRRELGSDSGQGRKVLLAIPDRALGDALSQPLAQLGYATEVLDSADEGGHMLEDGFFEVVITTRAVTVPGVSDTLHQRLLRLAPPARRRIFVVLVGDEFRTGDGTQAFVLQADLVVNPRDAAAVEVPMLRAIAERARLYQAFNEARRATGSD
jgi:predicted Zn finger-like uncharacterized protein